MENFNFQVEFVSNYLPKFIFRMSIVDSGYFSIFKLVSVPKYPPSLHRSTQKKKDSDKRTRIVVFPTSRNFVTPASDVSNNGIDLTKRKSVWRTQRCQIELEQRNEWNSYTNRYRVYYIHIHIHKHKRKLSYGAAVIKEMSATARYSSWDHRVYVIWLVNNTACNAYFHTIACRIR